MGKLDLIGLFGIADTGGFSGAGGGTGIGDKSIAGVGVGVGVGVSVGVGVGVGVTTTVGGSFEDGQPVNNPIPNK